MNRVLVSRELKKEKFSIYNDDNGEAKRQDTKNRFGERIMNCYYT